MRGKFGGSEKEPLRVSGRSSDSTPLGLNAQMVGVFCIFYRHIVVIVASVSWQKNF